MDAGRSGEDAHRLPQALFTEEALPLYDRTAARLLADLESGGARPGDRLPSERLLSERYKVSRVTLRAALAQLQSRGIVDSSRSRGWLVKEFQPRSEPEAESPSQVPSFTDLAAAQGLVSETRVLSTEVRPASMEEAETLRMAPGAPLFELRRLRYLDQLAIAVEHNRLPLAVCPDLAKVDFERESLYATLRRSSPPQIPSVADYSVEARSATAEEQRLLDMTEPVPLLVATQLSFNQFHRPIELTIACYRGDRYRFRASIGSGPRA
jgi:GntR family transcriptional regulator